MFMCISYFSQIVAPFNGLIYDTSEAGIDQVTLEVEDLKETQVIMGNVKLNPDLDRREVHIHLAYGASCPWIPDLQNYY